MSAIGLDRVTVQLERRRQSAEPSGAAAALAIALHLAVLGVGALMVKDARPLPKIGRAIPIRIVSGGPAAAPAPSPTKAPPRPDSYLPTPAPKPPEMRTKTDPVPVRSDPKKLAAPETTTKPSPPRPAANPAAAAPQPEAEPEARPGPVLPPGVPVLAPGSGTGVGFASDAPAFDEEDFQFPVYIQQMLSAVSRNWYRPQAESVGCTVYFKIGRDGRVVDWQMEIPSGVPHFDRAAIRALLGAAPFPPLPADFAGPSLGVHLRFQ